MGVYSTLMTMLGAADAMAGVSLVFGEENITAQEYALPLVVVAPRGGPFNEPGYAQDLDPNIEAIWRTEEAIDMYLWAHDAADTAVANADATSDLLSNVLRAFQSQRDQGLYFKPASGKWQWMNQANVRYGRAYVLTVMAEIAFTTAAPVEDTLTAVTINSATITPPA